MQQCEQNHQHVIMVCLDDTHDITSKIFKQEAQRATYRAPEYNVPPLRGIYQGGPFCLLISPKNANLVKDVEILLSVKLR